MNTILEPQKVISGENVPDIGELMSMTSHLPEADKSVHNDLACSVFMCTHEKFFPKVGEKTNLKKERNEQEMNRRWKKVFSTFN